MRKGQKVWIVMLDSLASYEVIETKIERLHEVADLVYVRIPTQSDDGEGTVVVERKTSEVYKKYDEASTEAVSKCLKSANKHLERAILLEAVRKMK